MDAEEYLKGVSRKYAGIERVGVKDEFNGYDIYEPIKLSGDNAPKVRFKNTIRKTTKFLNKIFSFKSKVKQRKGK